MKFTLKDVMLPLLVLAFVGVAVTFLAPIFTTTTRWLALVLVLFYLVVKGKLKPLLRSRFVSVTIIYGVWSLATVIWSERPELSALKAIAFNLSALTCIAAGFHWARVHPPAKALDFLLPLTIAALSAGLLGRFSTDAIVVSGNTILYQGLVGGPNMFGSMLAMCSPFLAWKVCQHWRKFSLRSVWLFLSLIAFYYLLAASSRGAILIVLVTLFALFLSMNAERRAQWLVIAVFTFVNGLMIAPGQFERLQQQFIYKQAAREQGVFYTRVEVWGISYEQAVKGGLLGGGYGVTIGDAREFIGGLTIIDYGREKGNSQLAIVEETGLVGFVLYCLSLILLFGRLISAQLAWPRIKERQVFALVTGVLAGMIVGSIFEAWWVAPGSPESCYFWSMAGIGLGLASQRPSVDPIAQPSRERLDNFGPAAV